MLPAELLKKGGLETSIFRSLLLYPLLYSQWKVETNGSRQQKGSKVGMVTA